MGFSDLFGGIFGRKKEGNVRIEAKCPKCGAKMYTDMPRCPKCGTHTELLFRIKCPKCGEANKLDEKECHKCREPLYEDEKASSKQEYICPICGYRANFYMTKCPACNTRFV